MAFNLIIILPILLDLERILGFIGLLFTSNSIRLQFNIIGALITIGL